LAPLIPDANDTIAAHATPQGIGALGIIRLSGSRAFDIAAGVFRGADLRQQKSHTIHFGRIADGEEVIDEVLASVFVAPHSYTRENVVEFSCHGSRYILDRILRLLIARGARLAKPGEFTLRAFLHGQFDLAQAEAVADLIASESEAAHRSALQQMRGGFSMEIKRLRGELVDFASLIELELDFGEEDVEFASREQLRNLVRDIHRTVSKLAESFRIGNVVKNGVPTVIAGKPNAGKSTLLNALLNEEKAIVSDIPGTTRDFIEDEIHIQGISFRFIDTAGIREARDKIEAIGIQRTREKMQAASLIIYLFDLSQETAGEIEHEVQKLDALGIPYLKVGNKIDAALPGLTDALAARYPDMVLISAKKEEHIEDLKSRLVEAIHLEKVRPGDTLVTNARHYESLQHTRQALEDVLEGLDRRRTGDLLAQDLRQALHYLGEITGEITTDDLLANIFGKFCIGK
jgi:tRNA modification GTPase